MVVMLLSMRTISVPSGPREATTLLATATADWLGNSVWPSISYPVGTAVNVRLSAVKINGLSKCTGSVVPTMKPFGPSERGVLNKGIAGPF